MTIENGLEGTPPANREARLRRRAQQAEQERDQARAELAELRRAATATALALLQAASREPDANPLARILAAAGNDPLE